MTAGFAMSESGAVGANWQATFIVPPDSILFGGHFPGRPVLPGVGLLSMLDATLAEAKGADNLPLFVGGLRRVKFRQLVECGGIFKTFIRCEPTPTGGHAFSVVMDNDVVMDGLLGTADSTLLQSAAAQASLPPVAPQVALEDLIPHRYPMRIVDELLGIGDDEALSGSVVQAEWPLVVAGSGPSVLLVEAVAQTASACIGWEKRNEERLGGKGFLVGIRMASVLRARIGVGLAITTRIKTVQKRHNFAVFRGTVAAEGRVLCTAEIQAFRPPDE